MNRFSVMIATICIFIFLTIAMPAKAGNPRPIEGYPSSTGVGERFCKARIMDLGHALPLRSEMQQFDFDKKGNVYYAHVGHYPAFYEVVINKAKPSRDGSDVIESAMKFYYLGHPTSMDIEDGTDGKTYVWIPEFSTKTVTGDTPWGKQYWNCQTIARVEYRAGAELFPWDESIEYFFAGNEGDINVSVDFKHDILCVTYHKTEKENFTRRIITYRLSEAMALPMTDCQLRPVKFGGDGAPDAVEQEKTFTIKAHDLRALVPVNEFGIPTDRRMDINLWSWQGFEYYDGLTYFFEGTSEKKGMGNSVSALTIFDSEGKLYERRTCVDIASNPDDLLGFGISETGTMESEGVKIWKNSLYLGFDSRGFRGDKRHRANVFKYRMPKRR